MSEKFHSLKRLKNRISLRRKDAKFLKQNLGVFAP